MMMCVLLCITVDDDVGLYFLIVDLFKIHENVLFCGLLFANSHGTWDHFIFAGSQRGFVEVNKCL